MTAQCPETLLLRGEKLKLCTEPLGQYLKTMDNPIRFHATTTVLWRGYIGTWTIEKGRLYLKELWGNQGDEDGYSEVGMEALLTTLMACLPTGLPANYAARRVS